MNVQTRNDKAKQFILDQLSTVAQLNESDFEDLPDFQRIKSITQDLIYVKAMGFRGIVATALTGKFLDDNYDYLNDFYKCNPRSIFENGIFYAFQEMKIPCGKSDPLNVAKNNNVLDENWAKGRRPQKTAMAAVDLLRIISSEDDDAIRQKTVNYFFFRLLSYSRECGSVVIHTINEIFLSNQIVASKLINFTLNYPESGTIPQFVISRILSSLYNQSSINVIGGDESVFGTNTTSKKPADIWLENEGVILNLYEITVKKIDYKRLDDSIQSLADTDSLEKPIIFICRLPDDINTLDGYQEGVLTYKNKSFNFVDISEFIKSTIALLSLLQIELLLSEIKEFVGSYLRPIKTKNGWNEIFAI
ncbi:hypothetical protein O1V64_07645 [Rouxiella badensis]|uniref:Restriction endonuclease n=1 Tax=Rouxiella badensis TaxID=1646377 RepID=A0A1X0W9P3_9GAMM|nr:hypothetical protein [Rouxiella badensis]ORJ23463.1 hypothetical protein BS640_21150 [Rouxiella badensis]WAT06001.1 hypothetical protein O1V64_07645 [Rouxiella badensis]